MAVAVTAFERVLDALSTTTGHLPHGRDRQYQAVCPAHDDKQASLSVTRGNNRVLLKCHAGCDIDSIVAGLDLRRADLFDEAIKFDTGTWMPCGHGVAAEYRYTDEDGAHLFTVVRCPQKCFSQWVPDASTKTGKRWSLGDTRRVLYRLPAVVAAVETDQTVWIVEGEKDADRLVRAGVCATTSPHGAGKWRNEYAETLHGAAVTIVADRDVAGRAHAQAVADSLTAAQCTVEIVEVAEGKDISDHLDGGLTLDQVRPQAPYGFLLTEEFDITMEPPPNGHEPEEEEPTEDEDDEEAAPASWTPVDLTLILEGNYTPEEPSRFIRTDGQALLYPGRVHSFHGESESGKSLLAQIEATSALAAGEMVLYIDYESDAASVVGRLREMGATIEQIRDRFHYVHPEVSPFTDATEKTAWLALLAERYSYAVIDGVTDALGISGVKSNDNDEIATWFRRVARKLAKKTGAAVVMVDHVTKDQESRGRYAVGGQAKMNGLDGAAYMVEVIEAIGRGLCGIISMRVAKDRPGGIRNHCGPFRKIDRSQGAALITVDSRESGAIQVAIHPPAMGNAPAGGWQPTALMVKVSKFVEEDGPVSKTNIRKNVPGRASYVDQALALLVEQGYVTESGSERNHSYAHIRPFGTSLAENREDEDDDDDDD